MPDVPHVINCPRIKLTMPSQSIYRTAQTVVLSLVVWLNNYGKSKPGGNFGPYTIDVSQDAQVAVGKLPIEVLEYLDERLKNS